MSLPDLTARMLLMPVLLGQAVYLRRRVIKLPEPAGLRQGTTGQGLPLRLLILGDSSAAGVGVDDQRDALLGQITGLLSAHATVRYDLVAQSGARTGDVLDWLDTLPADRYDVVFIALGVNDIIGGVSLPRWLAEQTQLLDRLDRILRPDLIVVSGLPQMAQLPLLPNPLRWVLGRRAALFDRKLHALVAARPGCRIVTIDMVLNSDNMSVDGFHPGPIVYAEWARGIVQIIRQSLPQLDAGHDPA